MWGWGDGRNNKWGLRMLTGGEACVSVSISNQEGIIVSVFHFSQNTATGG